MAHFSASTGIDFAQYALDEPIQYVKSNAIQSATQNLQNNDWTRRKLLEQHALGGRYITLVGSPEQVADELESWISETGLDGFNLTRIVTPESYVDFIELVIRATTTGLVQDGICAGNAAGKSLPRHGSLTQPTHRLYLPPHCLIVPAPRGNASWTLCVRLWDAGVPGGITTRSVERSRYLRPYDWKTTMKRHS